MSPIEVAIFDLKAGSASVLLTSGCRAHFHVRRGKVDFC